MSGKKTPSGSSPPRRPDGRRESGGALVLVVALVAVALSVVALLVAASRSALETAGQRLETTRARLAALSGIQAGLDRLNRTGDGGVEGWAGSLDSIRPGSGPLLDLEDEPDGAFSVRAERRGETAAGPHFLMTVRAKWGRTVKAFEAAVAPVRERAFSAGFFGDEGASVAGLGRVEAFDSRVDPLAAIPGRDVLGSNGDVSLTSSRASSGGPVGQVVEPGSEAGGATVLPAPERPWFAGTIYAPRAAIKVSFTGAERTGARAEGIEVAGNVVPGPDRRAILGAQGRVEGRTAPRERPFRLAPALVRPPDGEVVRGPLVVGGAGAPAEMVLPGGVTVVESLSVAGTLHVPGAAELFVLGDASTSGEGAIVLGTAGSLALRVAGKVTIGGRGIVTGSGPADRVSIVCGADSALDPSAAVALWPRGAVAGAACGRTFKATGAPIFLRHDVALAEVEAPVKASYRTTAIVEAAPPR